MTLTHYSADAYLSNPSTTLLTEFCIINENGFFEISTSFYIFILEFLT